MQEKEAHYFNRTIKHIQRVQDAALYLITECSEELHLSLDQCREIAYNITRHDNTKFTYEQFDPYLEFTWKKLRGEDAELPRSAWVNHYNSENHHPERLNGRGTLGPVVVVEMACDLQAMAEEFGDVSGRGYFDNVWRKKQRSQFANWPKVKSLMEKCFDCFESRLMHAVTERVDDGVLR